MRKVLRRTLTSLAVLLLLAGASANAHTNQARCDIYPRGEDCASAVVPCTFSHRQGHVSIHRPEGVRHERTPKGKPGSCVDANGRPGYRQRGGLGERGLIFRLAHESVYVYWDTGGLPGPRATAPAAEAASSAANLIAISRPVTAPTGPFDRTLELLGITFRVTSANQGSMTLAIVPSGLEIENSRISRAIDGSVTGAEVADLNADGSPEVYVYVISPGSGSYGSPVRT